MKGLLTLVKAVNVRHLFERKLRTFLTVSGVTAGVALVVSISVINTTLLESTKATIRNLAGAAELEVAAPDQTGMPEEFVSEVAETEGVQQAIPVLRATTTIRRGENEVRMMFLGTTPEFSSLFPSGLGEFGEIDFRGSLDPNGIVLSEEAGAALDADVDDKVIVETPLGHQPVTVTGFVSGHVVSSISGGDLATMFLPSAQRLLHKEGRVDSVYVVVDEDANSDHVAESIDRTLEGAAIVGPPGERGRGFEDAFDSIAALTSLSGIVALFVSIFVVYNTMSMSLAERRREISMAFAFGATRGQVFGSVLGEAAAVGIVASALGTAAGIGIATALVDRAAEQYAIFPGGATGATVVKLQHYLLGMSGLVVALVGAWLPARRVAGVAPIEALRPEARLEWARGRGRALPPALGLALCGVGVIAAGLGFELYAESGTFALAIASLGIGLVSVTAALPIVVPLGIQVFKPISTRLFGTVGRLSSDGLEKNPGRTTATVGALVLTLGLVIGVGSAIDSFDTELREFAHDWYGADVFVQTSSHSGGVASDQPLPADLDERFEQVPGIAGAEPFRYANLTLKGQQVVTYVEPTSPETRDALAGSLAVGGVDPEPLVEAILTGEIVISRHMAEELGLEPGDSVSIPTPQGARRFEIGGLFIDLAPFNSMHMGYPTYLRYWNDPHADLFGIEVDSGTSHAEARRNLEQVIQAEGIPAEVLTRDEMVGQVSESVNGLFSIAQGIQLAALIVAFFTIVNTMFTAILERRWEFGLQQAIGMSRSQLGRSVMLESIGIGLLGAAGAELLGLGLGWLMLSGMNELFSFEVPYVIPWPLFTVALGFGVVIAVVSGLYPRFMATRAPIIESLRYE